MEASTVGSRERSPPYRIFGKRRAVQNNHVFTTCVRVWEAAQNLEALVTSEKICVGNDSIEKRPERATEYLLQPWIQPYLKTAMRTDHKLEGYCET